MALTVDRRYRSEHTHRRLSMQSDWQAELRLSFPRLSSPFDAAVVFGYGPVLQGDILDSGKLNTYGRINALAAGMLYRTFKIRTIIPTGGRTGGVDKPSEAELIARYLQRWFNIPESVFVLEENATNTILNLVYTANIIDKDPEVYNNLLFVAMGFHLTRIEDICSVLGLKGRLMAAEHVVKIRSARHERLLRDLLDPKRDEYARILADQERWLYGLRKVPEYFLPQLAMLENPARLRRALRAERFQAFLRKQGITDVDAQALDNLRDWLRSMPRRVFPSPVGS